MLEEYKKATNKAIIEKLKTCDIYKPVEGWVVEYPEFEKLADEQMHTFWAFTEPDVDSDLQDLRVNMSEAEKYAVTENLKMFTLYEMRIGNDYWSGRIMQKYQRPEIKRLASMFCAVEFNSHAPFYNKANEVLYLDTEDFYSEWKREPTMRRRMEFIGKCVNDSNDLVSLSAFSFIEGAVLYSSFAFFKHFQAEACGKNLIKNICRGIDLSVADENTHSVGGALLFKRTYAQVKPQLTQEEDNYLKRTIYDMAKTVYEHEESLIDKLFAKGELGGITKNNLKDFVKHRVNLCLNQLGYEDLYDKEALDGFIESWFYKDINSVSLHDTFTGNGSEYNINWDEDKFGNVW